MMFCSAGDLFYYGIFEQTMISRDDIVSSYYSFFLLKCHNKVPKAKSKAVIINIVDIFILCLYSPIMNIFKKSHSLNRTDTLTV